MAPSNELNDPNTDILIEGTVLNKRCRPITNAVVDIWYAGGNPSKWLFLATHYIFLGKTNPECINEKNVLLLSGNKIRKNFVFREIMR